MPVSHTIAQLDKEIRTLEFHIREAEESLLREGWPEIAVEASWLDGQLAELLIRRENWVESGRI